MPLETGTQIGQLDPANPPGTDPVSQADDHLRLIKVCVQGSLGEMVEIWGIPTNDLPLKGLNAAGDAYIDMIKVDAADRVAVSPAGVTTGVGGDLDVGGNVVIVDAGKGIDFSANAGGAGATSKLFDDYEEGTFVPVLSDGTNNATTSLAQGNYTKKGQEVTFYINITTTSLGSVSGTLYLTGLPYTANAGRFFSVHAGNGSGLAITAGASPAGYVVAGTSEVLLAMWDLTTGISTMQASEWTDDGSLMIAGSYII